MKSFYLTLFFLFLTAFLGITKQKSVTTTALSLSNGDDNSENIDSLGYELSVLLLSQFWPDIIKRTNSSANLGILSVVYDTFYLLPEGLQVEVILNVYNRSTEDCSFVNSTDNCYVPVPINYPLYVRMQRHFNSLNTSELEEANFLSDKSADALEVTVKAMLAEVWPKIEENANLGTHLTAKSIFNYKIEQTCEGIVAHVIFDFMTASKCKLPMALDTCWAEVKGPFNSTDNRQSIYVEIENLKGSSNLRYFEYVAD